MTNPATRHLAVLAFAEAVERADLAVSLRRLRERGALAVEEGVCLERRGDGTVEVLSVPGIDDQDPSALVVSTPAVQWLIDQVRGDGADRPTGAFDRPVVGESFAGELHELLPTTTTCVAFVSPHLDAGAVVEELDRIPGARLVYGVLRPVA